MVPTTGKIHQQQLSKVAVLKCSMKAALNSSFRKAPCA